jgi:superkiller protein 3
LQEALNLFDDVVRLRPGHEQVDLARAIALSRLGRWGDAVLSYHKALLALGPPASEAEKRRVAEIHDQIGVASLHLGWRPDAEQSFLRAIEADPRFREAYAHLAELYEREQRVGDAQAVVERLLNERPNDPPTLLLLARFLDRAGRDGEAVERYREYLAAKPDAALALTSLGMLLGRNYETDGAIKAFKAALAIDPALASARSGLQMALVIKRGGVTSRPAR